MSEPVNLCGQVVMLLPNNEPWLKQWLHELMPLIHIEDVRFTPVKGLTGVSWHVSDGKEHWLLRSVAKLHSIKGLLNEYTILRKLKHTGLVIKPIRRNADCMILPWIEGDIATAQDINSLSLQQQLANILVRLHQAPCLGRTINIHYFYHQYWSQIDRHRMTVSWFRYHRKMMAASLPRPLKRAPLHLDLHGGNMIKTAEGALHLIDWEFALDGDIALELAAFFLFNNFNLEQQHQFLLCYQAAGGYQNILSLKQHIQLWQPWVRYLNLLWFEVKWQQTHDKLYLSLSKPLMLALNIN